MDDRQNMMENGGQQENTENMENTESTENAESRMKENPAQGLPAGTKEEPQQGSGKKKSGYRSGFIGGFLTAILLVAVLVGGVSLGRSIALNQAQSAQTDGNNAEADGEDGLITVEFLQEVSTIYQRISQSFLYDYDNEELRDGMLSGLLEALDDSYSVYYNESEMQSFNDQTQGEYYGIGCSVSQNAQTGIITIVKPYEGAPAYEAGLQSGDILYAVNDELVTGTDLDQVVSMIKGAEGSTVKLTIQREGESEMLDFNVERRQVEIDTVEAEMLDGQIGYIAVSSFDGVTPDQFIEAFEELKAQGMKGLIIDMRNNGGGLLTAVEEMLDYLLPEGEIFYAMDKNGTKYSEYSSDAEAALDVPLAVLVNGNTASAAEVFSGNIQDFGVGTLVGTTTFGKGIMQNTYSINAEGTKGIKLTVADYYIHSGRNIHGVGLTPDVEVELTEGLENQTEIDQSQDNQLQEALRIVREQVQ